MTILDFIVHGFPWLSMIPVAFGIYLANNDEYKKAGIFYVIAWAMSNTSSFAHAFQ